MYKALFDEFLTSHSSLQVYEDGRLVFASYKSGLLPLLEYIDRFASSHRGVVVFDKIMGHAAALLCVKADCREIYSPLGSELAVRALDKYGIKHYLIEVVPCIQKPDQSDMCPLERLSIGKEPQEFYQLVAKLLLKSKD